MSDNLAVRRNLILASRWKLDAAGKIADPAERALAFDAMEKNIDRWSKAERAKKPDRETDVFFGIMEGLKREAQIAAVKTVSENVEAISASRRFGDLLNSDLGKTFAVFAADRIVRASARPPRAPQP